MSTVFVGMMLAHSTSSVSIKVWRDLASFILVMGAAAFNCWMEIDVDKLMDRTKERPLPAGRMAPIVALIFSSALMIGAIFGLYWAVNTVTAILGLIAQLCSMFLRIYTSQAKKCSCSYVGAIPGAIPPLMGWTIVMGKMTELSWALFAILFVGSYLTFSRYLHLSC